MQNIINVLKLFYYLSSDANGVPPIMCTKHCSMHHSTSESIGGNMAPIHNNGNRQNSVYMI